MVALALIPYREIEDHIVEGEMLLIEMKGLQKVLEMKYNAAIYRGTRLLHYANYTTH